jgi:hypothetical protein
MTQEFMVQVLELENTHQLDPIKCWVTKDLILNFTIPSTIPFWQFNDYSINHLAEEVANDM